MITTRIWKRLSGTAMKTRELRAVRAEQLRAVGLSDDDRTLLTAVPVTLHRNDGMYARKDPQHYLSVGMSAVHCIDEAIKANGGPNPVRSVLDFPCGHGRVLRFLRTRFPDAEFTGAELDEEGLAFCARAFGITPVRSNPNFAAVSLARKYDLIWCGSLITHLSQEDTVALLRLFRSHLAPGGVCVFTNHGEWSVHRLRTGLRKYMLTPAGIEKVLGEYDATGYGYAGYEESPGYGVSICSKEKMLELCAQAGDWTNKLFQFRGWDNHQDVFAMCAPRE